MPASAISPALFSAEFRDLAVDLIQIEAEPGRDSAGRLPPWLRKPATDFGAVHDLKAELRRRSLHTVCESARCPNMHECFSRGTATFMILGNTCTRTCGFCAVPQGMPGALDPREPAQVASMARAMDLSQVVITSVNRDDLPDVGSVHFAATVRAVKGALPRHASKCWCRTSSAISTLSPGSWNPVAMFSTTTWRRWPASTGA